MHPCSLISDDLAVAIDSGQLDVHYQPKVGLRTGAVIGLEALARWRHPWLGMIRPARFVPLAEASGLVHPLTRRVLAEATAQWARWRAEGHTLELAVNLSPCSLEDASLPGYVAAQLAASGMPGELLRLELTESSLLTAEPHAGAVLAGLRDLGVRLSLDDFGTGYASFAALRLVPVDELKVDRSFVRHATATRLDAVIVRSTIVLAHDLGLQVVAEGVEDAATWELLADLGCDAAQGYWLSRPLPAARIAQWLAGRLPAPQVVRLPAAS